MNLSNASSGNLEWTTQRILIVDRKLTSLWYFNSNKMRGICVTMLVVLLASNAFSQTKFGFKVGLNLSGFNASFPQTSRSSADHTSFTGGFCLRTKLTGKFDLQPELLFSGQGEDQLELDYLILPCIFSYPLNDFVSVQAGPQLGYLLSSNFGNMNDIDFGIAAGIEGLVSPYVNLGFRYVYGITDNGFAGSFGETKNQVFQFTVGFVANGK